MNKLPVVAVALTLLSGCAAHPDKWTRTDTVMYGAYATAAIADSYSTTRFQYSPYVTEATPFVQNVLGDNPKTSAVWQGLAVSMAINYVIARAMPSKWRKVYLGAWATGHTFAWRLNCRNLDRHTKLEPDNPLECLP